MFASFVEPFPAKYVSVPIFYVKTYHIRENFRSLLTAVEVLP